MQKEKQNWYASWFNTPFYHILYKERNDEEAGQFMRSLTSFLQLSKDSTILDVACGKGRHSVYLHTLGYDVTGVDLAKANIEAAKEFETNGLKFEVHDMCIPYPQKFDAVFNLFTSFGYFEHEEDNFRTIKAFKKELKKDACGVIDFLNVAYVEKHLVTKEVKNVDGIDFNISRAIESGYIVKNISFQFEGQDYAFTEKVKAITLTDFKSYFAEAGLELAYTFGDYNLTPFQLETSPRLILIFNQ